MDSKLATDYNATRQVKNHHSFCNAPSLNMYFSQNGDVKVCCHNSQFILGTYPKQTIKEIWSSSKAKELREHMRKFDLSYGCEVCQMDINLRAFNQVQARHFDPRPLHPEYPTMMEFLISNKCNLECTMCQGEYSSLIRKNREKLPPLEFPYDHKFITQLEEFIPHLHEARFSGSGEAFLIDMNYDIWEMIIKINPDCIIMVQTNGTILTQRAKEILNRGNFQIGVSLDSLDKKTYESIRLNANHDKVMENIRWFSNYSSEKKRYFMLAMCVMRQNWKELPAFIKLCNELNAAAVLHKVWSPTEFALFNLPFPALEDIQSELSTFTFKHSNSLEKQNYETFNYFLSVISRTSKSQF